MEDHHNGVTTTEQLEEMVADKGVLFREFRGDGFMVMGEDTIFIVKDHDNNDFEFSELSEPHIQEVKTEEGRPTHRLERKVSAEDREVKSEEARKPSTEITIWTHSQATTFYVDSQVHKVSAAFVNFRTDD